MTANKSQVIVMSGLCASHSIPVQQVHHRDFPEVCGEGSDSKQGAKHLVNLLLRARSSVSSGWRRNNIDQAIADVEGFLDDLRQAEEHN